METQKPNPQNIFHADVLAYLPERIRTFAEVAVGPMDIALFPCLAARAAHMILIEPHPVLYDKLLDYLLDINTPPYSLKTIGGKAIGFEPGTSELVLNPSPGCSYLQGTWSPTPFPNRKPGLRNLDMSPGKRKNLSSGAEAKADTVPVEVITFDTIDNGEIDAINIDCEGME